MKSLFNLDLKPTMKFKNLIAIAMTIAVNAASAGDYESFTTAPGSQFERAAVMQEARDAVAANKVELGEAPLVPNASVKANDRSTVRRDAVLANRAGLLSNGELLKFELPGSV